MSTCIQTSGSTPNGPNTDIRTTNINLINNNCNNYRNYGNDMAITALPTFQTLSTLSCSDIGIDVNSYGNSCVNQSIRTNPMSSMSSKCVPSIGSNPQYIQIPFGWKRELIDGRIVYYSPTNSCLRSLEEVSKYLESEGTCKCGLECPLHISKTFSFESCVLSKPYDIEIAKNNNHKELCYHKRKIIAFATYRQHSLQTQQLIAEQHQQNQTPVPIREEPIRETSNSFCLYDQSCNSGIYSFSACDSTQISVQSNDNKTSIYLTPQNTPNYGQMLSYDNPNVNLIQSSHPQTYNHYSHPFHPSENVCNSSLSSYIPLASANANSGAISFSTNQLPTNAISINPYHSGLHTPQDSPHCQSQNNISILPMPPIPVSNGTTVTTSVTDVIPAVGIAPQISNQSNTSGAPQVLQFINSVPLTQITANTVTVLQQSPAQEVSVPAATLIIPQLMSSHEDSVVINHAMAPQTVFPHIATATGLTALPNPFSNTISIANALSLPQRTCVTETVKPSRSRRRKEYNRSNRSHPPTVASILKQVALKEQEMNDKQKIEKKDQESQTICDNIDSS